MFVYKSRNYINGSISGSGAWERDEQSNKLLKLLFKQKKLSKIEITILDIGANIG